MATTIEKFGTALSKEAATVLGVQLTLAIFVRSTASNFSIWGRQLTLSGEYGLAMGVKETAFALFTISLVLTFCFVLQLIGMTIFLKNKKIQRALYFLSIILSIFAMMWYFFTSYTTNY
ncbi:MAG: hypothetical protein WC861_05580 [Candidatus Micrarchaeia archaeon]|jgi:hypothetical protein